ncbi:MAG: hypothetical protein QOH79_2971 [Acidimicrobiaceae bacterium]
MYDERLSKVQDELEALLAARPVDDFTTPAEYRSLVLMESVLLKQVKDERVLQDLANSGAVISRTSPDGGGAGGNRTPVRRAVTDRATTIPEIAALRLPHCRVS